MDILSRLFLLHSGKFQISGIFDSYRCSHLGHDLPYDDESGFSEYQTDWKESKEDFWYMGDELVDQAVHHVRFAYLFFCLSYSKRSYLAGIGHTVSCGGSAFRSCSVLQRWCLCGVRLQMDPAYSVVQVATNDLIILVAFVPIIKFLLGVSNVVVPYSTLFVAFFCSL